MTNVTLHCAASPGAYRTAITGHHWFYGISPLSIDPSYQNRLNLRLTRRLYSRGRPPSTYLVSFLLFLCQTLCVWNWLFFFFFLFSSLSGSFWLVQAPLVFFFVCGLTRHASIKNRKKQQQQRILAHINSISRHAGWNSILLIKIKILTAFLLYIDQPYFISTTTSHHIHFNSIASNTIAQNKTTKCTPPVPQNQSSP